MKNFAFSLDFGCLNVTLILFSVVIKRKPIVLRCDKMIALFLWRPPMAVFSCAFFDVK